MTEKDEKEENKKENAPKVLESSAENTYVLGRSRVRC